MDINKIKKVQKIQLFMMRQIHDVCEKHGIKYYLIGGSALGAVRHKGVIPWDIDIDIAMMRDDYDKFVSDICKYLPKYLECKYWKKIENYKPPHAVISLKDSVTTLTDHYLNSNIPVSSISIDLFPIDYCPDVKRLQEKQANRIKQLKSLKRRKLGRVKEGEIGLKVLAKRIIRSFLSPWSINIINEMMDKEMRRYDNGGTSQFVCSMASHYSYFKQCMPYEIYGEPILMDFEDQKFFVPNQVHEYLRRIYGDYNRLPSEEEKLFQINYYSDASWPDWIDQELFK